MFSYKFLIINLFFVISNSGFILEGTFLDFPLGFGVVMTNVTPHLIIQSGTRQARALEIAWADTCKTKMMAEAEAEAAKFLLMIMGGCSW